MPQVLSDVNDKIYFTAIIKQRKSNHYLPIRELLDKHDRVDLYQSCKKLAVFIYELCATHKFDPVEVTQGWLAKQLCYSRQTISRGLNHLEQAGLVQIIRSTEFKKPHKYLFCAPLWLKKLIEKLPKIKAFLKRTMSSSVTRSDLDLTNIKDQSNNNILLYSELTNTYAHEGTFEDIQISENPIDKTAGYAALEKIRSITGNKRSASPPPDPDDKEKYNLPDLKTCTDPDQLEAAAHDLVKAGKPSQGYDYLCRANVLRNQLRLSVRNDKPDSRPDYNPWATEPHAAKQPIKQKEKKIYASPETLPVTLRQRIRRDTWHLLNRTKERDPAELAAQVEFAIIVEIEKDEVKFAINPLELAFNRVKVVLKRGDWDRPFGYVDIQTKMARDNEALHYRAKIAECKNLKSVSSITRNLSVSRLPYTDN